MRLVTGGQGIRASGTHSFPLATGPTGKPSLPGTELSMGAGRGVKQNNSFEIILYECAPPSNGA